MENYVIHFHQPSIHIADASRPIREQLARLIDNATLAEEEEGWTSVVNLLVAAIHPACVYKVEHRFLVRGVEKRYCNLIIVLTKCRAKAISEFDPILQLVHERTENVQCFFHHIHTVVEWIAKGHPFYCRYLVNENLIYSDDTVEMPHAEESVIQQMKEEIRKQFAIFFGKAQDFYQCAKFLHEREQNQSVLVAFMLHQAVDLGYRSILESLNGQCKKTHDIWQHMQQAVRCAPSLNAIWLDGSDEAQRLIDILETAYSGARYMHAFSVSDADLKVLMERVQCFLESAEALFNLEIGDQRVPQ